MSCFPKQRRFLETLLEPAGQWQRTSGSSRAVQTRPRTVNSEFVISGSGGAVGTFSSESASCEGIAGGLVRGPSDEGVCYTSLHFCN